MAKSKLVSLFNEKCKRRPLELLDLTGKDFKILLVALAKLITEIENEDEKSVLELVKLYNKIVHFFSIDQLQEDFFLNQTFQFYHNDSGLKNYSNQDESESEDEQGDMLSTKKGIVEFENIIDVDFPKEKDTE